MAKSKQKVVRDEHSDRSEYLELQSELVARWSYADRLPALARRMGELRPHLAPEWLASHRTCTTPPPPIDIVQLNPEFASIAKTTVRLNPRLGSAAVDASKMGGTFLWPKSEEWPHCHQHDSAFVPAIQLQKADFPEVVFPDQTDLMQVLWCPNDHKPGNCPDVRVVWRERVAVTDPVQMHPEPTLEGGYSEYIPQPCLLYPERIIEYPDPFEEFPAGIFDSMDRFPGVGEILRLNEQHARRMWSTHGDGGRLYQCALSTAEGTKLGGYPDWVQDPWYPKCDCGAVMDHLMSFGSAEFDGETWFRWLPIEERDVLDADLEIRLTVQVAAGCTFGDMGNMYVYVCRSCRGWPTVAAMQCS